MANQEQAFIAAMGIAAKERPDCFSIKDGDFYFLKSWRLPGWLVLAIGDELSDIAELQKQQAVAA